MCRQKVPESAYHQDRTWSRSQGSQGLVSQWHFSLVTRGRCCYHFILHVKQLGLPLGKRGFFLPSNCLTMPSCLTLHSVPLPVPALGTYSGIPGTPFCCLACRLSLPKSSLMSPNFPSLLEHNVLPWPSQPASLLLLLYLGLSSLYHHSTRSFLRVGRGANQRSSGNYGGRKLFS